MINLCSDGHDEICYEGNTRSCPVCIIIDEHQSEKADFENEVDMLNGKIYTLKNDAVDVNHWKEQYENLKLEQELNWRPI